MRGPLKCAAVEMHDRISIRDLSSERPQCDDVPCVTSRTTVKVHECQSTNSRDRDASRNIAHELSGAFLDHIVNVNNHNKSKYSSYLRNQCIASPTLSPGTCSSVLTVSGSIPNLFA